MRLTKQILHWLALFSMAGGAIFAREQHYVTRENVGVRVEYADGSDAVRLRAAGVVPDAEGIRLFLERLIPTHRDRQRVDQLISELGSKEFEVRQRASARLASLANPPLRALKTAAESEDLETRYRARRLLSRLTEGLPQSPLVSALRCIEHQQLKGMTSVLLRLIPHWDHELLDEVVRPALAATATDQDLIILQRAIRDGEFRVRLASIDALLKLQGDKAARELEPLLHDSDQRVRLACARVFADHGRRECLDVLIDLLASSDGDVHAKALEYLQALTGNDFPDAGQGGQGSVRQSIAAWRRWLDRDAARCPIRFPIHQVTSAGRILNLGGRVRLADPNELQWLKRGQELPWGRIQLTAVDLRDTDARDEDVLRLADMPQLVSLDLSLCSKLSDKALGRIGLLQNLQHLNLEDSNFTDQGIGRLARLTHLKRLQLGRFATDAGLSRLGPLHALNELSLNYAKVTDEGLLHISNLKGLRRLRLYRCSNVSNNGLVHLTALPNLHHLVLTCPKVSDEGLAHLAKIKNLQDINLYTTQVTGIGIQHLVDLPLLRSLNLARTKIDDQAAEDLGNLSMVNQLNLSYTQISDGGLKWLGQLSRLTHLYLESTPVRGDGLQHLSALPNLAELHLYNSRITDQGLRALGELRSLRFLDIGNTSVTDDGLSYLSELTRLTGLDVSRSSVSDRGLRHLHGLRELSSLNRRRTRVTERGVEKLKLAIPTLREIR